MIGAILEVVSVASALAGLFVAAKGTSKTQAVLSSANQHDKLIDAMAWLDRKVLRAP